MAPLGEATKGLERHIIRRGYVENRLDQRTCPSVEHNLLMIQQFLGGERGIFVIRRGIAPQLISGYSTATYVVFLAVGSDLF